MKDGTVLEKPSRPATPMMQRPDLKIGSAQRLFRTPVVITAPHDLSAFSLILPRELTVLALIDSDHDELRFVDGDNFEYVVPCVPTICLGALSISDEGHAYLLERLEVFTRMGAMMAPKPRRVAADANVLEALSATNLLNRLREQAQALTDCGRELSALRSRHETMQEAFAELEKHVASLELQPIRLVFENLPSDYPSTGGPQVAYLVQKLPVDVFGLSALEIHLETATAGVEIVLRTLEDSVEHCRWRYATEEIAPGWLTLALPQAVAGARRTAELVLTAVDEVNGLPLLSVGPPLPHVAFRIHSAEGPMSLGALAFRAWKGLPGVRVPASGASLAPKDMMTGVVENRIPYSIIEKIVSIPGAWRPDFNVHELRPNIAGFLCHPGPDGQVTLAALDGIDLSRRCLVSATASLESDKSAPVEFAIAASNLPAEEIHETIAQSGIRRETRDFVFSGWRRVLHGKPALISIAPAAGDGRLYFATRMADGQRQWFAWAIFSDIRQVLLGGTQEPALIEESARPKQDAIQFAADRIKEEGTARANHWLEMAAGDLDGKSKVISCTPPARGIGIRRLPPIDLDLDYRLESEASLTTDEDAYVDCALAISTLEPRELGLLVSDAASPIFSDRVAFSGWRRVDSEMRTHLSLEAKGLGSFRAHIFLLTRYNGRPSENSKTYCIFGRFMIATALPVRERL